MNVEIYQGYANHTPTFKRITEAVYGLPVPESLLQAWTSFSRATSALDFYLDRSSNLDDRNRLVNMVLAFAHPQSMEQNFTSTDEQLNDRMEDFRDHLRQRPLNRQESFFRALKQTLSVTEQIKQEASIDELV